VFGWFVGVGGLFVVFYSFTVDVVVGLVVLVCLVVVD
jgi:hypothetical protein